MSLLAPDRDLGQERVSHRVMIEERRLPANVTALAVRGSHTVAGLGDGSVLLTDWDAPQDQPPLELARHSGAITGLAMDSDGTVFSAGQDGKLAINGKTAFAGDGWIGPMARSGETVAVARGCDVLVFNASGQTGMLTGHPSTVTDIAFDPTGQSLAASHIDGLSLWSLEEPGQPEKLIWKGSMTAVSWSPDGRYAAGATQDREIHVWDMITGRDFRLGGFQSKVRQIAWTSESDYMISSGADVIAAWPMVGDPGAFPPKEVGYVSSAMVTAVANKSPANRLYGGFSNGALLVGETERGEALIARSGTGGAVTRLACDGPDGWVSFGTRDGVIGRARVLG